MNILDIISGTPTFFTGGNIIIRSLYNTTTNTQQQDEGKVFVRIDNSQSSCSEEDLFYISSNNISELYKFEDIDGFYKISVVFVDGRELQFEYYSEEKRNTDYRKLLKYFKNETETDEDSDSDSDSE